MVGLIDVVPGLNGLLNYLATERRERRIQRDQALTAIYTAATETKIYLERLRRRTRRNRRTEEQLVRLWRLAAIPVAHFDRELANKCLHKADYWLSPKTWVKKDVEKMCTGIIEIHDQARKLLLE